MMLQNIKICIIIVVDNYTLGSVLTQFNTTAYVGNSWMSTVQWCLRQMCSS